MDLPLKRNTVLAREARDQVGSANRFAYDARFRRLIGSVGWAKLPVDVQRRFSKRVAGDQVVMYPGAITQARFSKLGWVFAQAMRIIGAPLPLNRDLNVPAAVSVSEDHRSGGQCWTRVYSRLHGFPQVIHSAKRFAGPTGLEEHVGFGLGMALRVEANDSGLRFTSDHYFWQLLGRKWRIPRWLAPGETVVRHSDIGGGRFIFSLQLSHPVFGELVFQEGVFRDA